MMIIIIIKKSPAGGWGAGWGRPVQPNGSLRDIWLTVGPDPAADTRWPSFNTRFYASKQLVLV